MENNHFWPLTPSQTLNQLGQNSKHDYTGNMTSYDKFGFRTFSGVCLHIGEVVIPGVYFLPFFFTVWPSYSPALLTFEEVLLMAQKTVSKNYSALLGGD